MHGQKAPQERKNEDPQEMVLGNYDLSDPSCWERKGLPGCKETLTVRQEQKYRPAAHKPAFQGTDTGVHAQTHTHKHIHTHP